MVQEIGRIVLKIVERGVPVVLVEQNAELALAARAIRLCAARPAASRCTATAAESARQRACPAGLSWRLTTGPSSELAAAGWSEADLDWEQRAGGGAGAPRRRRLIGARGADRAIAVRIAHGGFAPNDPRLGTSLANHGAALVAGRRGASQRPHASPTRVRVWRGCDRVDREDDRAARRRARRSSTCAWSSATAPAYEARWRIKWAELVAEARGRVGGTARVDARFVGARPRERLARWRRERPAMLNDTRKLMAAVILLACARYDSRTLRLRAGTPSFACLPRRANSARWAECRTGPTKRGRFCDLDLPEGCMPDPAAALPAKAACAGCQLRRRSSSPAAAGCNRRSTRRGRRRAAIDRLGWIMMAAAPLIFLSVLALTAWAIFAPERSRAWLGSRGDGDLGRHRLSRRGAHRPPPLRTGAGRRHRARAGRGSRSASR